MSSAGLPGQSRVGAPLPNLTGQSPRAAVPVNNARAEASRRNGAKSRGLKTIEGKARSAQTPLKLARSPLPRSPIAAWEDHTHPPAAANHITASPPGIPGPSARPRPIRGPCSRRGGGIPTWHAKDAKVLSGRL
jgi:hypothetical protein